MILKTHRIRSPKHLAWVRTLECAGCFVAGAGPIQAAHLRKGTDGGMGLKPSDCYVVPLCEYCHHVQHKVGEMVFWCNLVDLVKAYAVKLWEASQSYRGDDVTREFQDEFRKLAGPTNAL